MAKEKLADIELTFGTVVTKKDGTRSGQHTVSHSEVSQLAIDRELGIIYLGDREYSIHSNDIKSWRPIGALGGDAVRAKAKAEK